VYRVKVLGELVPQIGVDLRGVSRAGAFEMIADAMPTRRLVTGQHD
jgi:hypothetical protein